MNYVIGAVVISLFMVVIWALSGQGYFWPIWVMGGFLIGGIFYGVRSYKTLTPYGSIGDPSLATEETGHKGYAAIVDWLSMVIKRDFFEEDIRV